MDELTFPYEHVRDSIFGPIYLPTVKVEFKTDKRYIAIWMIADTGADQTIIPRYLTKQLGISLEKDCTKDKTFGVGGETTLYFLKKKHPIRLGKWEINAPLGILDSDNVPPLLGRLGFMESFNFLFGVDHLLRIFRKK